MGGGDLLEAIRKKKVFSEKEASKLFSQVITAIAYLHANGIAHRDIKVYPPSFSPHNILLIFHLHLNLILLFFSLVSSSFLYLFSSFTPTGTSKYSSLLPSQHHSSSSLHLFFILSLLVFFYFFSSSFLPLFLYPFSISSHHLIVIINSLTTYC
jgi:serine/threonine protein kinase